MAWMASNLYLRTEDHTAAVDSLAALLALEDRRADQSGVLDPPPPLLVSPPLGGWLAITGGRGWFGELGWAAAELSRRAGGALAVSAELIGNSYAYRLSEHEHGAERVRVCKPDDGAFSGAPRDRTEMIRYCDAEREVYEQLIRLGVPPPLAAIGTSPLGHGAASELLGEGTSLAPAADGIERSPLEVRVVPFKGEDPPVIPCAMGTDFGVMLFEDRYVEGRPNSAALDRLLEIEEEILARARRARPGSELTLTVTYHGGIHQGTLDEMLRQRGRPTAAHVERGDRIPWWQFWRHFGRMR